MGKFQGVRIEVPDLKGVVDKLVALNGSAPQAIGRGLRGWAEVTMGPIRRSTPVDTGALRGSLGFKTEVDGANASVTFYAGGPAARYAAAVHENLSPAVRWRVKGTGPKYIENPLRNRLSVLDAELGAELDREIKRVFGTK